MGKTTSAPSISELWQRLNETIDVRSIVRAKHYVIVETLMQVLRSRNCRLYPTLLLMYYYVVLACFYPCYIFVMLFICKLWNLRSKHFLNSYSKPGAILGSSPLECLS